MIITEHEIFAFCIGAAVGSVITYYNVTREKRAISSIRDNICLLASYHNLTPAQSNQTLFSDRTKQIASDDRILDVYRWALRVISARPQLRYSDGRKMSATILTAEVIICEELLGLDSMDAVHALRSIRDFKDLGSLRPKSSN